MKHLKKFNESIEVDWSKPYKEIEKSVLSEINRIFKKTKSGVGRFSFSKEDLEWSGAPSVDYEYKDGKLVKVRENKVFLILSKSIREELDILEEIEDIYDDLNEKFMEIIDMLNFDASFELSWDYFGPKFKEEEYVDFKVIFNFEKLNMPSYGKSIQNISSLIGNESITYWTNSDKKLTVCFRHKK